MTKILNIIIVVLMIALIATFIVSAVSMQGKTDKIAAAYALKREELLTRQQQIQDMIASLNSTLQSEIGRQQAVAAQLGTQTNSTMSAPTPIITPAPAVPTPPPAPVVVQPAPMPRVTRAS